MQKVYEFKCVADGKSYGITLDQQHVQRVIEEEIRRLLTEEMEGRYKVKFSGTWVLREKNIL